MNRIHEGIHNLYPASTDTGYMFWVAGYSVVVPLETLLIISSLQNTCWLIPYIFFPRPSKHFINSSQNVQVSNSAVIFTLKNYVCYWWLFLVDNITYSHILAKIDKTSIFP